MDLNVLIPAILLIVSEILPFIKHHESNGIMHLLYLILNAIITDQGSSLDITQHQHQLQPVPISPILDPTGNTEHH